MGVASYAGSNRGDTTTYVELDFPPYHLDSAGPNPLRGAMCDKTAHWEAVVPRPQTRSLACTV